MALWGNKDSKTASGTVAIANTGIVTGTSTAFTTEAKVGNTIRAGGIDYQIVSITSDTVAKVIMGKNNGNGTVTTQTSGTSYTLSEKPAFVAHESADTFGDSGDANKVFGVDVTEIKSGGDNVQAVAVIQGGSGYLEVPAVSFSGGAGSNAAATATISGGSVTSIAVTNVGSAYTSAPTVNVNVPRRTIPTANINTSTEVVSYTGHGLTTGDAIKYYVNGGAAATGLTDATTYYAGVIDADTFYVYDTADHAVAAGATGKMNISGTGNNAQYFDLTDETTATAASALGDGAVGGAAHAGWVRRTVGTGGRAGRVFYETLVASGTTAATAGDQSDDIQFPDA
jgi:hypothetical protein